MDHFASLDFSFLAQIFLLHMLGIFDRLSNDIFCIRFYIFHFGEIFGVFVSNLGEYSNFLSTNRKVVILPFGKIKTDNFVQLKGY